MGRLEMLQELLAEFPDDAFGRYGLAMEYSSRGEFDEALTQFKTLLATDQTYVAAYYHAGQALEKTGNLDDARHMYERGIEACQKTGDLHTRAEIEAALSLLPI